MKKKSILTKWDLVKIKGSFCLFGETVDDDRFKNGTRVQTSKVLNIDFENGVAETRNTIYELA